MKYYLIAGEASGDLHGSNLMRGLYARDPEADLVFLLGLFLLGLGLLRLVGSGCNDRLGLLGTPAEVDLQAAQDDEVVVRAGAGVAVLPGVEGIGIVLGVEFQVQGYPVGQADVGTQAGTQVPEGLDGVPEVLEELTVPGQVGRFLILQADGGAHTEQRINADGTVFPPAEEAGAPIQDEVQVRLDVLVAVEGFGLPGSVLALPAVYGETEGPAVDELPNSTRSPA